MESGLRQALGSYLLFKISTRIYRQMSLNDEIGQIEKVKYKIPLEL
jgi:hypothetical protein